MTRLTAALRAAALLAVLAPPLSACGRLFERQRGSRDRVADFVGALDPLDDDARTPMLVAYARGVDEMVGSTLPIIRYAPEVQRRQTCYWATYGHRAGARETAMLNAIADDETRMRRWRDYVVASTDLPAVLADEHVCDA